MILNKILYHTFKYNVLAINYYISKYRYLYRTCPQFHIILLDPNPGSLKIITSQRKVEPWLLNNSDDSRKIKKCTHTKKRYTDGI